MANYNFKEDIHIGEAGEDIVVADLESLGLQFVSNNKDNKHDILMVKNGKDIKYEIKTDVWCVPSTTVKLPNGNLIPIKAKDNGNLFIEFECRGKPSGIEVTMADWFVTYFKHYGEIWYIKTSELKTLLENNNFEVSEFSGDAGSNTKGYLVPRNQYKEHFIIRNVKRNE